MASSVCTRGSSLRTGRRNDLVAVRGWVDRNPGRSTVQVSMLSILKPSPLSCFRVFRMFLLR